MNAISTLPPRTPDDVDWAGVTQAVNAWRGRLINVFARGEAAVSETLLTLSEVEDRKAVVPLSHLVGQRLEDLHGLLSKGGPFAAEGEHRLPALAAFREHEALRPLLCHGLASIWLKRNGRWAVQLEVLAFRSGKQDRRSTFLEQREAEALLQDVSRRCQRMEAMLAEMRAALTGRTGATGCSTG